MFKRLSIGLKLALLAGVPVLGALVLALFVADEARDRARDTAGLGSVERVAELSSAITEVVARLQAERAWLARHLGERAGEETQDRAVAFSTELNARVKASRESLERLDASLGGSGSLPSRLSENLRVARDRVDSLEAVRQAAEAGKVDVWDVFEAYRAVNRSLLGATAALSDLTDDGELLRTITALVAVLELTERASEEHAVLAYTYEAGAFSPGGYRRLVTLVTEQQTFELTFRTHASASRVSALDQITKQPAVERAKQLRTAALEAVEDEVEGNPDAWFETQQERLTLLWSIGAELNDQVRSQALARIEETNRAIAISAVVTVCVLFTSILLALVVGRRISRGVTALGAATARMGQGDFTTRVRLTASDELGQLASAFNEMAEEIGRSREALQEKARLARELEIAASIQCALLPPQAPHEEFEFAGRMAPADEVGGDFYDILRDDETRRLWLTIGDVSSHGLSSGLVMLMAQSAFASHFYTGEDIPPDQILRRVNRLLSETIADRLKDDKYLTAQLLVHVGNGSFVCAGAHEWPLIYRAREGRCELVETPGPWLGLVRELKNVPTIRIDLDPGDVLCLYTDGLTEARNGAGDLFDVPRLAELIATSAPESTTLESLAETVFGAVESYALNQEDDWTLLLVRRKPA